MIVQFIVYACTKFIPWISVEIACIYGHYSIFRPFYTKHVELNNFLLYFNLDPLYLDHPVEILQGELLRAIQNGGQGFRLRSALSSGGSIKG